MASRWLADRPDAPGTVTLYDVATGQKRLVQDTNSGGVLSVAYSPDGKTLAIGNADRTLKLWTPESGRQHSYAHHNAVSSVAFSPDGNTVVSAGSRDDAVKVWDVVAAPEPATLHQKGAVYSVAFSPDGRMLACGGDRSTKLWDVATGREAATVPFGHRHGVGFTAFSHDGKTLAISSGTTVELIAVGDRQEPAPLEVQTTKVEARPSSPADKSLVHDAGMNGFFVARLAFSRTTNRWPSPAITSLRKSGTWQPARFGSRSRPRRSTFPRTARLSPRARGARA